MPSARHDRLLIHAAGDRWDWCLLDRQGTVRRRGQCAPDQPDWPGDLPARVVVDAALCVGLKLDLPDLPPSRQARALRWAAEEYLSGGAEDEHVVAGPRDAEGQLCCVVIGNEPMTALTGQLAAQSIEVMLPDALCLPWQPGEISLAEHRGRVLARWDEWSFGSFEPELLAEMFDGLVDEQARWCWYGGEPPEALEAMHELERRSDDALAALAARAVDAPVNLLAGRWSPDSTRLARGYWKLAAGLAGAVAVLALSLAAVERFQLASESQELQAQIEAEFRAAFPGMTPAGRHRELAERELARLRFGESAGLLELMNQAAPVIDAQEEIQLDGLDYRDGRLELSLRAPDVAALDQFERRLRALDLQASVQSASLEGDQASGRVRITAGG